LNEELADKALTMDLMIVNREVSMVIGNKGRSYLSLATSSVLTFCTWQVVRDFGEPFTESRFGYDA
jgi:hypothetical protein